MSGQPGDPIQPDELDMVMRLVFANPQKIAVADMKPHVEYTTREKSSTHTVNGKQVGHKSATVTIRTSSQVERAMAGTDKGAPCHVLMVAIPAEMVDEARKQRDSLIVRP